MSVSVAMFQQDSENSEPDQKSALYAVSIHDPDNIGDQLCSPVGYVDFLDAAIRYDLRADMGGIVAGSTVILGSGGVLHPPYMEPLNRLAKRCTVIAWGVGHNFHDTTLVDYPSWMDKAPVASCRDFGSRFEYVPCPTCLHPYFDEYADAQPKHDLVIYQHHDRPIPGIAGVRKLTNGMDKSQFRMAIEHIASARYVLTNCWHGAYWSMLLNRTPILYAPFASRFFTFETPLPQWTGLAVKPMDFSGYLERCREANLAFAEKVKTIL